MGDTVNIPVVLLAIIVPPHEPVNNCQLPAVPKEPPLTVSVLLPPEHNVEGVAVKDVGLVELVLTVIVTETQAVVLHVPTALTKYVVLTVGDTEKEPVELLVTTVPVQDPESNCQVAPLPKDPPLTVRVVGEPLHIVVGLAVKEVGAVELLFTVTVTEAQVVVLQVPTAFT